MNMPNDQQNILKDVLSEQITRDNYYELGKDDLAEDEGENKDIMHMIHEPKIIKI